MIKPNHRAEANGLKQQLLQYQFNGRRLPGLVDDNTAFVLTAQLIDSLRRIRYVHHIRDAKHSPRKETPWSGAFDPLCAAVLKNRRGELNEAWWLVFLATHFGKHIKDKWALTEAVYGKLNQGGVWDWLSIEPRQHDFRIWLQQNLNQLAGAHNRKRFSNHRKYETLNPASPNGLPTVVNSYVEWMRNAGGPAQLIRRIHNARGQQPETTFDALYEEMKAVKRFGRLGTFDFLTMLGKLGIAPIEPGSAYLRSATGPKRGARLLFLGSADEGSSDMMLDQWVADLDRVLHVGPQVLEDALCNWQKSPSSHIYFRG